MHKRHKIRRCQRCGTWRHENALDDDLCCTGRLQNGRSRIEQCNTRYKKRYPLTGWLNDKKKRKQPPAPQWTLPEEQL